MFKFLFKQTYRASITQLKNYFGVIVALVIVVAIGGFSAITQIQNSPFSLQAWVFELAILCSAFCFTLIVFGKRPPNRLFLPYISLFYKIVNIPLFAVSVYH